MAIYDAQGVLPKPAAKSGRSGFRCEGVPIIPVDGTVLPAMM
jgi:hypothetical protein